MLFNKKDDEVELVSLLASLLVCFPAMAKVTLDTKQQGLVMDFVMTEPPASTEEFEKKRQFIMDSLQFYNQLENSKGGKCGISYSSCALHVYRDWDTLTGEEIDLLVTLVRDKFGDVLQVDQVPLMETEMLFTQQETITPRIMRLRQCPPKRQMMGIREDGRVMIYDNK